MRIVKVWPKDIHVTIELSLTDIGKLIDYLDHCEMRFDGESEPEMKLASAFVEQTFYPTLKDVHEDMKHGN